MGFLDSIFGEDKPVPTATPNVKTPINKSQSVETLTPNIIVPTATPVQPPVVDKYYHIPDNEWNILLRNETGPNKTKAQREAALGDPSTKNKGVMLAVGPAQLHPEFVEQVNKLIDVRARRGEKVPPHFTLQDRNSTEKSRQMVDIHQYWIGKEFEQKYGRQPNSVERAQLHQAGSMKSFNNDSNKKYRESYLAAKSAHEEEEKQNSKKK